MADYTHTVYTLMKPTGVYTNQTLEKALEMFHTGKWLDVTNYKTEQEEREKNLQKLYVERYMPPDEKPSAVSPKKKEIKKCRKAKEGRST